MEASEHFRSSKAMEVWERCRSSTVMEVSAHCRFSKAMEAWERCRSP
jgi:hypothetical protein